MGSYVEEKEYERCYAERRAEFELKTVLVKRILGIPCVWVKQSKYRKEYFLFNFIPLFSKRDYTGGLEIAQ